MRTRSQPLSPSGFVSLDNAPKAKTNLRKKATKKSASSAADGASAAATTAAAAALNDSSAPEKPDTATDEGQRTGQVTRKRATRAAGTAAEGSATTTTTITTTTSKASAANATSRPATTTARKTRGASSTAAAAADAHEVGREEELSEKVNETATTRRRGKRKATEEAARSDEDAPRSTRRQKTAGNVPFTAAAAAAHITTTTTSITSPTASPAKFAHQNHVPAEQLSPPASQSSQEGPTTTRPNEVNIEPITTHSRQQEPTPPIPSFTSAHSLSFESDNEPRFLSQPDPITHFEPSFSMAATQKLGNSSGVIASGRASSISRARSQSARPAGVRRVMTPYAERQRRRRIENEGRIDKTMFRLSELVKQNEEDVRKEEEERGRKGREAGKRYGKGDIYSRYEAEKERRKRAEEKAVEALKKMREEGEEAERLRDEEEKRTMAEGASDGSDLDGFRTPSPPASASSSQEKGGWLPAILTSVPRSISRALASPFATKRRPGRTTPRTESRIGQFKASPQYSFSPNFSKWASKFAVSPVKWGNKTPSSSQETTVEGKREEEKEEKPQKVEEKKRVREKTSQKETTLATKATVARSESEGEKEDDLGYSLLPQPLQIVPMHDDIMESIERSDSPPVPSNPTSDDIETIYENGIPVWDSEKPNGGKRKRSEKEFEVDAAKGGARWEGYERDEHDAEKAPDVDEEDGHAVEHEEMDTPSKQLLESQREATASFYHDVPTADALRTIPEDEEAGPVDSYEVDDHSSPAMKRIKRVRFDHSPQDTPSKLRARRSLQNSLFGPSDKSADAASSSSSTAISTPTRKHFAGLKFQHLATPPKYTVGGAVLDFSPMKMSFNAHPDAALKVDDVHAVQVGIIKNSESDVDEDEIEYATGPKQIFEVKQPNKNSFGSDVIDSESESESEEEKTTTVGTYEGEREDAVKGETASLFSQSFNSSIFNASKSLFRPQGEEQISSSQLSTATEPPFTPKKSIFTPSPVMPSPSAAPATPSTFASPSAPAPANFTVNAGMTPGRHDPAYLEKISKMRENAEKYKPKKSSGLRMSSETPGEREGMLNKRGDEQADVEAVAESTTDSTVFNAREVARTKPAQVAKPDGKEEEPLFVPAEGKGESGEKLPENYDELMSQYMSLEWPSPKPYAEMFEEHAGEDENAEGQAVSSSPSTVTSSEPTSPAVKETKSLTELVNKYWTKEDSTAAYLLFDKEFSRFLKEKEEVGTSDEEQREKDEESEEESEVDGDYNLRVPIEA